MSHHLQQLRTIAQQAAFNRWLGLEVISAAEGEVELRLSWREEFGQYTGLLHAGVMGGLLETACGFAASTMAGGVLASQFSMRCLRPAKSDAFVVRGRVVKSGRRQIFAAAEIFGRDGVASDPYALGDAVLTPT